MLSISMGGGNARLFEPLAEERKVKFNSQCQHVESDRIWQAVTSSPGISLPERCSLQIESSSPSLR